MSAASGPTVADCCERAEKLLSGRATAEAAQCYRQAIGIDADSVRAHVGLGRALNNLRQFEAAEQAFARAARLTPNDAGVHNFLGHVRRARGDPVAAEAAFRRAVDIDPALAPAWYNLGTVLAAQQRYLEASQAIRHSLAIAPANVPALLSLAEVCQFADRHADAAEAIERAAAIEPHAPAHPAALGDLYYSLGEVERARDAYARALELDPANAVAVAGRALLHELWGDIDAGWRLLEPWLDMPDTPPAVGYATARLLRRRGQADAAREMLESLRDSPLASEPRYWFTLGETRDAIGQWDDAFAAFDQANKLKPSLFDPLAHDALIDALTGFFSAARFAGLPRASRSGARPLFIVGMPRSGTTLVEQILASHGAVHAGGERFELPAIVADLAASPLGYPGMLAQHCADDLTALSARYLDGFGAIDDSASVFTDKLPKNFLNLGLISLLFPDARVVALERDPRDVGLSVYFQNLNVRSDPWACRLGHIAAYTRGHDRLMSHWRKVLPVPLLTVRYERLVEDLETQVRRLLDFAGLDFNPRCLAFHETRRLVNTASYAQVRRPLYRSSLGRWRNYAGHLGPLAGLIEDMNSPG